MIYYYIYKDKCKRVNLAIYEKRNLGKYGQRRLCQTLYLFQSNRSQDNIEVEMYGILTKLLGIFKHYFRKKLRKNFIRRLHFRNFIGFIHNWGNRLTFYVFLVLCLPNKAGWVVEK